MAEEKIIGFGLGTTNSVVAVMEGGEVKVIPNQEGNRLAPSVVAFTDKGERLVGDPAKRQAITNSRRTVFSIKRFMGRRHNEVQTEEKLVPYQVVGGANELVKVDVDGKQYTPPEISATILRKLKEAAEAYLGHTVRKAIITVPAYFNDAQRQATIDAAQIAGFDTEWEIEDPKTGKKTRQRMRIINEPTAASLAYGLDKKKNEKIAVFDLGGGTFDISILDVGDGVFEVKGVNGDTHLGGDDFEQVLIDYIADEFKKDHGIDLRKDQMAFQRLKEAAERAKKDLSQAATTDVNLPFITADASGPKHLQMALTRSKFEQLTDHLIERCRGPVLRALSDAKYKPPHIDEVVLVGGMTRVPKVKKQVFSTAEDNQPAVTVRVFQGEREMAADNRLLGQFNLEGIPPAPRGMPQIEVAFDIDANGILNVSAKDLGTGKEQKIEIKGGSGLDEAEVEQMIKDAEAHADEDRRQRELAEARNVAENAAYQADKQLSELGDKVDEGSKSEIE